MSTGDFRSDEIGVVGMGLMGSAILRMTGAAYGWDIDPTRCHAAADADDVFSRCTVIFLCLPTSIIARSVIEQADLARGTVVIDTSTGDPDEMTAMGVALMDRGVQYLDATISGSSAQILKKEVLVMVGGDEVVFQRCQRLLMRFASDVVYVGQCGNGARMKLVTNLVLGLNRAALAEGLIFARELGLDEAEALSILRRSMAASRIMDTKGEKMVSRDFTPQARLAQHLKDVRLMLARSTRSLPLTQTHAHLLERAVALGHAEDDNSAIIRAIEQP